MRERAEGSIVYLYLSVRESVCVWPELATSHHGTAGFGWCIAAGASVGVTLQELGGIGAAGPDAVGEQYILPPCCSHDSPTLRTPPASEQSNCVSRPAPSRGPSRQCGPRRRSVGRGLHQNELPATEPISDARRSIG